LDIFNVSDKVLDQSITGVEGAVEKVLAELGFNRGFFPHRTVLLAQQMQAELTPILLQVLADVPADPVADPAGVAQRDEYLLPVYAMYLLAYWREPDAFDLFVQLFATESEWLEDIAGDILTEDLHSLLASCFSGDLAQLDQLVCDPELSQYFRGAVVRSLLVLYAEGALERPVIEAYFQQWLDAYLLAGTPDDFALSCLVEACCELHCRQLLPQIELAYQRGLVDEQFIELEDVARDLAPTPINPRNILHSDHYHYVHDVVAAMDSRDYFAAARTDEPGDNAFEPRFFRGALSE
jgi:hypothetical protein